MLHKNIYDKHPEINSVIIAHAPHIMAFAVTDREFDSRTIPESYIQLRTVSKVPYGSSFMQPEMVAEMLTPSNRWSWWRTIASSLRAPASQCFRPLGGG